MSSAAFGSFLGVGGRNLELREELGQLTVPFREHRPLPGACARGRATVAGLPPQHEQLRLFLCRCRLRRFAQAGGCMNWKMSAMPPFNSRTAPRARATTSSAAGRITSNAGLKP